MGKQLLSLRHIYKIHSSRLASENWKMKLTIPEAIENKELINLASSSTIRFIDEIAQTGFSENEVSELKRKIARLTRKKTNAENKRELKKLNVELHNMLFLKHYMCLIVDSNKHYDRANEGFEINGVKYKRLLATNGGVKKSTIVYVSEQVHEELEKRINNGRDMTKPFVVGKLEAYRSLSCSASVPVSQPKGILVVHDVETEFKDNVVEIDDSCDGYPLMQQKQDYDIKLADSDGYGLIMPDLSNKWGQDIGEDYMPTGFCIRNSYCKGMMFTFDFQDFAEKIAKNYTVKDVWGQEHDIRDIDMILTTSMLKLWDSYVSLDHYLECCQDNGYAFSVTKATPQELENERNMNYQFIQSLKLSDEDIRALAQPTIDEIHSILGMDYRKAILYMKGVNMNENNAFTGEYDYGTAVMVDKRMMQDPHTVRKILDSIKQRINDAKIGVLKVRGNFSVISGDPYSLCQSVFGLEVTGLLKSGEYYAKYWIDRNVDRVVAFRAPMTCHNNIRVFRVKGTKEMQYWYKYMPCCTIFNSWDTSTHALNGADKDGDTVMTTDNEYVLKGVEETEAIVCIQKNATKVVPTEADFIKANKQSFGDEIGSITNVITSMFSVQARFEKGTPEWEELDYRIKCGQNYQQNSIDKAKGIVSKPMPKEWYDFRANKVLETDPTEVVTRKMFNQNIVADKKPYFFNYIYPTQMKKYRDYVKKANITCMRAFNMSVDDLRSQEFRTEEEENFLMYYGKLLPSEVSPCIMNKICWMIEDEFDGYMQKLNLPPFDVSLIKTETPYSKSRYKKISELYDTYIASVQHNIQMNQKTRVSKEDKIASRIMFMESFKQSALEICNNAEELCNIVIDLCYHKEGSKQFAWDISGEQIVKNLLAKNDHMLSYLTQDEDGDVDFKGCKFSIRQIHVGGLNDENDSE